MPALAPLKPRPELSGLGATAARRLRAPVWARQQKEAGRPRLVLRPEPRSWTELLAELRQKEWERQIGRLQ